MEFEFLNSLFEAKKGEPDGTFVGVRLSAKSKTALLDAAAKMKVPNRIPREKLHATLIYSRKYLPEFEALGKLDPPLEVEIDKLDIFKPQEGDNNVLVVKLKAPALTKRHNEIMREHGATYDFDKYRPHITLSYDCNDFDVKSHDIKDYVDDPKLEIAEEYQEDLNLNWAK